MLGETPVAADGPAADAGRRVRCLRPTSLEQEAGATGSSFRGRVSVANISGYGVLGYLRQRAALAAALAAAIGTWRRRRSRMTTPRAR